MPPPILLCTDGSTEALDALVAGVDLLGRGNGYVLVTVADVPDPDVLSGTGHAGAELSAEEFDLAVGRAHETARQVVTEAEARLGLDGSRCGSSAASRPRPSVVWPPTSEHGRLSSVPGAAEG